MTNLTCPICGQPLEAAGSTQRRYLPFCSERCRLIDLGRWLGESYRIAVDAEGQPLASCTDVDDTP